MWGEGALKVREYNLLISGADQVPRSPLKRQMNKRNKRVNESGACHLDTGPHINLLGQSASANILGAQESTCPLLGTKCTPEAVLRPVLPTVWDGDQWWHPN